MNIGKLLASVNNKKNTYYNQRLKKLGLSHGQAFVINVIGRSGKIQQDELTRNLEIDKSAVTRILKTLENRNLIRRCTSMHDRRGYEIYLSTEGLKIYPEVNQMIDHVSQILCAGMSEKEQEELVRLLLKMKKNLEVNNEK